METQLIMVEGLPGSGKSTTSRWLAAQLRRNGIEVQWYHEVTRPHPVLFFHQAAMKQEEYEAFCREHPEARELPEETSEVRGAYRWWDLLLLGRTRKAEFGEAVWAALNAWNTWDFSMERYCELALDAWRVTVAELLASGERILLESAIFQYQIYGLLLFNPPAEAVKSFVRELFEIVRPLQPVLVYLYQDDVEAGMQWTMHERGEAWVQSIADRDANSDYFQAGEVKGIPRLFQLWREYRAIADDLFAEVSFAKLAIENSERDYAAYEERMLEFFGIERKAEPEVADADWEQIEGLYCNERLAMELYLRRGAEGLMISSQPEGGKRLAARGGLTFEFLNSTVLVEFVKNTAGEVDRLRIGGLPLDAEWMMPGTEFVKVGTL